MWPGDTAATVLGQVKDDLAGWQLNRTVWVADAGFTSSGNRKVPTAGGPGLIIAEKLRSDQHEVVEASSRQRRFRQVDEPLEVKDIKLGDGPAQQRFVMVRNPKQVEREAHTRTWLIELIEARIDGSDAPRAGRPVRSCVDRSGRSPGCGTTCVSPTPGCCV